MTEHIITVAPERTMSGAPFFRATCSCGKYRSGLHGLRSRVESAGLNHVLAKGHVHDFDHPGRTEELNCVCGSTLARVLIGLDTRWLAPSGEVTNSEKAVPDQLATVPLDHRCVFEVFDDRMVLRCLCGKPVGQAIVELSRELKRYAF